MKLTAIKAIYNRKTKSYSAEVLENACPTAAHEGWLVFDEVYRTIGLVICGRLISHWKEAQRQVVLAKLIEMGKAR